MTKARDRADRTGSDPIRVGNTVLETDSNNDLVVKDTSNANKKVIASEVHLGTGTDKVILKRSSSDGKLQLQTTDGSTTSNSEVSGDSGGSGGVTVSEEGSALSTTATTLNFVGSSVTASGSGSTKTITISAGSGGTTTVYANIAAMTSSSPSAGDQALVTANSGLYIYNGNGWYKIATINTSPTISSPTTGGSFTLATDGTATSIELVGADADEGTTLQNSYAVTSGSITNVATVTSSATSGGTYSALNPSTNTTNRFFKITPNTNNVTGSFALTFSVSDTVNAATTVQTFSLQFDVTGSVFFDGTGDYLSIPHESSFFDLGAADWTIECWVYFNDTSVFNGVFQLGKNVGSLSTMLYTDGKLKLLENDQSVVFTSNTTFVANTWYHIAFTNNDSTNTQKLYVNGVQESNTGSKSTAFQFTEKTVFIGGRWFSNAFQRPMNGYISNFRIVGGSEVYTSNFTVPTNALTAISNTKLLTANNLAPINQANGSAYFDGNGDYLLTATDSNLVIGSGDFTAECWIYAASFSSVQGIIDRRRSGDASNYDWTTYLNTDNTLNFYASGATRITSSALTANTWYHTAVVKNSGTTTLYVNGVSQGTWGDSATYPSNQITIGAYGPSLSSLFYNGYISSVRVVVGTAVYTTNFTPPTSPLTAVSGTQLLTSQNSTGTITDTSSNNLTITANGNTVASDFIPSIIADDESSLSYNIIANGNTAFSYATPFSGPYGSVYFDGTGDNLSIPGIAMGSGAYTLEYWFYATTVGVNQHHYDGRGTGPGNAYTLIQLGSDNLLRFFTTGAFRINGTTTISANTWYHVALQKVGNVNTLYLNGKSQGSYDDGGTTYLAPSNNIGRIGSDDNGSGNLTYGYISNFRMVVGSSVYTPTSPSGGSASFDGNGDYIDTTNPLSGTGDFTMEGWIYHTTSGSYDGYFATCQASGTDGGIVVAKDKFFVTHGGGSSHIGFSTIENNAWYHIVLQRSSNVFSLYLNGVLQGTISQSVNLTGSILRLGSRYMDNTTYLLTGYISNFRIVTGTAVYASSGFTPPNSALTAISNTQLLTCQNSTGNITDASSNYYTITANGNVAASTSKPFVDNFTVPTTALTAVTNTELLTCNDSNVINDASTSNLTITKNGNAIPTKFSPF